MQLTLNTRPVFCATAALLALLISACDAQSSGAPAASTRGLSYHIVVEIQPVDDVLSLSAYRPTYDACVSTVHLLKLAVPIKPFPQPPHGYVLQRHTYISDGVSFFENTEAPTVVGSLLPENGCDFSIIMGASMVIQHGGQQQTIGLNADGSQLVDAPQVFDATLNHPLRSDADELAGFSIKHTVNGVDMACTPGLAAGSKAAPTLLQPCIDAGGKRPLVRDMHGAPIVLFMRSMLPLGPLTPARPVVETTVKFEIGKPVDKTLFNFFPASK